MHTCLDGVTADDKSVAASLCALLRNVDDQIDLMTQDQVHDVRGFLLKLAHGQGLHAVLI